MKDIVSEYQQLLTSDESVSSLGRAVKLAVRIASGNGSTRSKQWLNLLNGRSLKFSKQAGGRSNRPSIEEVTSMLVELPRSIDKHFDTLPEQQYSLLIDTLLLVFHQAYFVLLAGAGKDRHLLLKSFEEFARALPRAQDQFQVRGLVEIEQQKPGAAVESFRAALAATHADEHDFLTRVQMVWMALMERGMTSEAFNCLIDVYPRVSRSDLGEIETMLRQTFLEAVQRRAQ